MSDNLRLVIPFINLLSLDIFSVFAVLTIKPLALHMLGKCSRNASSPLIPPNKLQKSAVQIKRKVINITLSCVLLLSPALFVNVLLL